MKRADVELCFGLKEKTEENKLKEGQGGEEQC